MKKSDALKSEKAAKVEELRALVKLAEKESRDFSDEENTKSDELTAEIEELDTAIARAEKQEAILLRNAAAAPAKKESEESKVSKRYSLTKALREGIDGKLTGLEAEMHQEAVKEAREANITLEGRVAIPQMMKRDYNVGTANDGGNSVFDEPKGLIEALRPKLLVEELGATVLNGLQGSVKFPKHSTVGSAAWEGETDANAETTGVIGQVTMDPNRVGAYSVISKQLLTQSSVDVDNFIANDLGMAVKIAIDAACINGSGSGQPTGILNTSGIGDVAGGTNGLAPTWAHIVDLETEITSDNADMGRMAYLSTPGIRGLLKQTEKATGTAQFLLNGSELNGYNAAFSTQVPSNLTKGTSSGVCHAIIFGNFQDLMVGYWGGVDIVVDPYTAATNAQIKIIVNNWVDVAVRHAESFAAMQDALLS